MLLLRTPHQEDHTARPPRSNPEVKKGDKQMLYLGGIVNECAGTMPEINRRIRLAWARCRRFTRELCDMGTAPFTPEGAHAEGRDIGNPHVRVCDVNSGPRTIRSAPNVAPPRWFPAPTSYRPPHVVRKGPQDSTTRERRDEHPETASPLRGGPQRASNGRLTRPVVFGKMAGGENPGSGRPAGQKINGSND